ncbi:metal-dependent hydrolase [Halorubellus sp. JP-L1]|uniref:metal-dependent hydrolase n=1 Tax=Halorubellus sp. JP-L1 TaxID=2715753 RepID=UPI00140973D3|nr:metal-dependent hydrolase [Halorubellus sp. JP-L1]NHN41347.1 metal-dependent hydrolase [Halorubellus sp. JP-L1]
MPSTLVHVALGGLVGCALLGAAFSPRAIAVVLVAVAAVDLDTFLGWVVLGAHRSAFHTVLLPLVLGAVVAWDAWGREESFLRARVGETAPRVAGVSVVAVAFAGIGPDLVTNGVNVLWPVHDQFYEVTGKTYLSDRKGFVQTFVDLGNEEPVQDANLGSSRERQYYTGADRDPGQSGEPVVEERVFPLANSGTQLLLVATGALVVASRVVEDVRERRA